MSHKASTFSGYKWTYYESLPQGSPLRSRAQNFLTTVEWTALEEYASEKRDGMKCTVLPPMGLGYNHMVRILQFSDGSTWVARLRLPSLKEHESSEESVAAVKELSEYITISLVRSQSEIATPHIFAIEAAKHQRVKAPFMLMECLQGNVGVDLGMEIPHQHKHEYLRDLARVHVQLSNIRLPKIGKIVGRNPDGSYQQGPIPGVGGPFNTATEYFSAWAAASKFGCEEERLRQLSGPFADEIVASVATFPQGIRNLASRLSVHDDGPFPLCHGDFGHNNTVVDDNYRIIGVIDWEAAWAAPWELFAVFPLTLRTVPSVMDAPSNYDPEGEPLHPDLKSKIADQGMYMDAVKEESHVGADHSLLNAFGDANRRELVTAMSLFINGKPGFYSKLVVRVEESLKS